MPGPGESYADHVESKGRVVQRRSGGGVTKSLGRDEIAGFLQKQPKSTSPITSGIRIVKGVGQMRHDSGKPHSGALFDVSQNAEGVAILASPTSHTRVQFEMHREHNAESGRLELKIPDLIDRMGRKMKLPVCEQVHGGTASIELVDRHQDQDIRSSSRRGH
jgi:hypothetical protein